MPPTGQVPVLTPSTGAVPVFMPQYDVNLYFQFAAPGVPAHVIPTVPIICADFEAQGIDGLLGRDILSKAVLIYHGDMKICTLAF